MENYTLLVLVSLVVLIRDVDCKKNALRLSYFVKL